MAIDIVILHATETLIESKPNHGHLEICIAKIHQEKKKYVDIMTTYM